MPLKDKQLTAEMEFAEMKCTFSVKPAKYQWKINGKALPDNAGITTSVDEEGTTFTIRVDKPTYKSRGKYSCEADNVSTSAYMDFDGEFV